MIVRKPVACPYSINSKYNDIVSEFNIKFNKTSTLESVLDFIQKYDKYVRINIEFTDNLDIGISKSVNRISDNVFIRVSRKDINLAKELKENNIKFFFDASFPAINKMLLNDMVELGVSDVYIADDLCYNLSNTSKYCHSHNVNLRLILNRIPSTSLFKGENIRDMFFCPSDIDGLSEYYDTFEFDCGDPFEWNKFNVLYRTFFIKKQWDGNIQEINKDIKFLIMNNTILNNFTYYKSNCKYKCRFITDSKCRKCDQVKAIADMLYKKNIRFKTTI